MRRLLGALQFLTVLPVRVRTASAGESALFFPLVGAILGWLAGQWLKMMDQWLGSSLAALMVLAFLALLTGAVHLLTGLAMIAGIRTRWAAAIEAAMVSSFVLLVHLPRVAEKPGDRLELTMLCIALTLSGAAWSLAASRTAR